MKIRVEFENGNFILDKFSDKEDFNRWVETAIADFGKIIYIEIL